MVMVALGPLLVGTAVATTLAHRLVSFGGEDGRVALLAAVVTSLVVVYGLTRRGTPTSLTLALTGGIVGAGLGAGLPVQWPAIGKVLAIGIAAPLLSVPAGWLVYQIMRGPVGRLVARRFISAAQYVGYLLQCLAYSANDAQKMVAIVAIGTSAQLDPVAATVRGQLAIAALFGVRHPAHRAGHGDARRRGRHVHPHAALHRHLDRLLVRRAGDSALGVPVSSTQAATGAAVGSGVATSPFCVRWNEVSRIGRGLGRHPSALGGSRSRAGGGGKDGTVSDKDAKRRAGAPGDAHSQPGEAQALIATLERQLGETITACALAHAVAEGSCPAGEAHGRMAEIEHRGDLLRGKFVGKLSRRARRPHRPRGPLSPLALDRRRARQPSRLRARVGPLQDQAHRRVPGPARRHGQGPRGLARAVQMIGRDPKKLTSRTALASKKSANEIRRLYDVELGKLFHGKVTMKVFKIRELLRRLDVVGLRLNEAADVLADAAVKRRA